MNAFANFRFVRFLALFVILGIVSSPLFGQQKNRVNVRLDSYHRQYRDIHKKFAKSMKTVEEFCEKKGMPSEATLIRSLASPIDFKTIAMEKLTSNVRPEILRSLPEPQRQWRSQLYRTQDTYSSALFLLSRKALQNGFASLSYRLLREVVRHNPDHPNSRRLLGFVRFENRWVTPFTKRRSTDGYIWHERFGWIKKDHVSKYEQGMRYYIPIPGGQGGWIPANQEAAIRQNFANAWEVETDHFVVKTNHSLKRGVKIAKELEDYYEFFFSTFAGFFNGRSQARKLFNKTSGVLRPIPKSRKHLVHYYKDRKEYDVELRKHFPSLKVKTNGLYLTNTRTSYFFHTPQENNLGTVYHEATHQLFYESTIRPPRRGKAIPMIASHRNFWVVEGIACYMESFVNKNGTMSLGDDLHPRFQAAKIRLTRDNYYLPLTQFSTMGMKAFQSSKNIAKNYTQGSGLSKFFMEYEDGKYRDALIDHLASIYRAAGKKRARVPSVEFLTGVSFPVLDSQYRSFISQIRSASPPSAND